MLIVADSAVMSALLTRRRIVGRAPSDGASGVEPQPSSHSSGRWAHVSAGGSSRKSTRRGPRHLSVWFTSRKCARAVSLCPVSGV